MKPTSQIALCVLGISLLAAPVFAETSQQQRRVAVLQAGNKGAAGLDLLKSALQDPDVMIRRAAVQALGRIGQPAVPMLQSTLINDKDALTRRSALRHLLSIDPSHIDDTLKQGMADADAWVRTAAVEVLAGMKPYSPETIQLLRQAQQDKDTSVSQVAAQALWPYHKEVSSVRERPEHKDHQLTLIQTIALPETGWKFQTDSGQTGHLSEWFKADFNDAQWSTIAIAKYWEDQDFAGYDGVAWYRNTITLPAKPDIDGADLVFDSVDESAWIWVNGQYVGAHDIGPGGWNKKFYADVSEYLKWGEKNQITIRVLDRKMAGGIWKPVYIEAVKDK